MMIFDLDLFGKTYFLLIKKLLRRSIERYSEEITGKTIDLGCGQKPYRYALDSSSYIGLDSEIKVTPDIVSKADKLPFKDERFDSAVCFEVLEHLMEPELCITEASRVLKKDGKLLLTVPFMWALHYEPHDYWRFTPYSLKILLNNNGFKIISIERIGGLFSATISRYIDVFSRKMENLIYFVPNPIKFVMVASIFHPVSLLAYGFSKIFDKIDTKDAFGWIVYAEKK